MKVKLNLKYLLLITIVVAAVLAVALFYVVLRKVEERIDNKTETASESVSELEEKSYEAAGGEENGPQLYRNDRWYAYNKDIETVLLIGLDKFEEDVPLENLGTTNNQRSDFLLLLILDHGKKTCQAVHINRDTMAEMQKLGIGGANAGTVIGQLALAHAYGTGGADSCENTAKAVSGFLYGVPVDHYVSVTMDVVPEATELVDGVTLTVMDDFSMIDPSMKEGTHLRLNGEQALSYVRARKELEDPTNARRMVRQRQFIEAFREAAKVKIQEKDTFIMDAFLTAAPYMVTDCTMDDLDRIAVCTAEYENKGIRTIDGKTVIGDPFVEFYADEEALKDLILKLFYIEA